MSHSAFSVQNKILPSPAVISPVDGDIFFSYISIVFDQGGLAGQFPKRAHYRVSYSADSQETDWTCIGDDIPVTTSESYLDVSGLPSSNDYSLKFELIDGENSSTPFFVKDITINNLNFFKIDTVPPAGVIKVRNNTEYIKDRDVILELTAYDKTSGTESFRIIQKEVDRSDDDTVGPLVPMSNISSWRIVNDDGVKLVQASFADYAGNELEPTSSDFFFRTYKSVDNREISSLLVSPNGASYDVWMAVGGASPELYLNGSSIVGAEAVGAEKYLPDYISGTSDGYEITYNVDSLSSVDIVFEATEEQSRLVVESDSGTLADTGMISSSTAISLATSGVEEISLTVTTRAASSTWEYSIESSDSYSSDSDFYSTAASQDKPVGEILSMAIYNDVLYLGEETKEAKGLLQRYTGGHIESVYEINSTDSLSPLDSAMNSMVVFEGKLYVACENGELYSFNGTSMTLETTFEAALNEIGTDNNLLYIFLSNSSDIYTAYKNTSDELAYVKTTLE